MNRNKWIVLVTIVVLLVGVTAAFAYGKTNAEQKSGQSYFDSLNEYDWSKTCPGASCRNHNEE